MFGRDMRIVDVPKDHPTSSVFGKSPLEVDKFEVGNLFWEGEVFDPTVQPLKSQVLAQLEVLGVSASCEIEELQNVGGCNEGMWRVYGESRQGTLVLKLVTTKRTHALLPTDVENMTAIIQRRPSIVNDHALTFPIKIFHCGGPGDDWSHDLIVMRKAPGQGLDATIAQKCAQGEVESLMQDLRSLGELLAQIHAVYGMQHGDLQPSNVFHDEPNGWFSLIDCGGMAPQPYADEDDVQHLVKGIALITSRMGEEFQADVKSNLEASYAQEIELQRRKRESDGLRTPPLCGHPYGE